ncbi:MAG: ArnT family glycosyltransferase [Limisphaerales bacterium]
MSDLGTGAAFRPAVPRGGWWLAVAWAVLFTLVAARWQWRNRDIGFHDRHGWLSAIVAVVAHNYAGHGFSRSVAPEHNYPSSVQPADTYGRWPPLYFMGVGGAVRLFGESHATFHLFALGITLLQIGAVGLLAGRLLGWPGGAVAAVVWATSPLMFSDGRVLHLLHLTVACVMLSLAALVEWSRRQEAGGSGRRWLALGLLAVALGCSSSWEAALMGPSLWLAAWWAGHRPLRRAAVAATLASAAVVVFWLILFNLHTEARADLLATLKMRMNLGGYELPAFNPYRLFQVAAYGHTQGRSFLRLAGEGLTLDLTTLGWLSVTGYLALPVLVGWRRGGWLPADQRAVLGCVLLMPLAWYGIFPRHALWHSYEMLQALPGGGLGIACLVTLWARCATAPEGLMARRLFGWVLGLAAPGALLLGQLGDGIRWRGQLLPKPELIAFGEALDRSLPAGAIVLVPEVSHVPLYYGRRPMIRGVQRREDLDQTVEFLRRHGVTEPVFFAARTADAVRSVTGRPPGPADGREDGALFVVPVDPPVPRP